MPGTGDAFRSLQGFELFANNTNIGIQVYSDIEFEWSRVFPLDENYHLMQILYLQYRIHNDNDFHNERRLNPNSLNN